MTGEQIMQQIATSLTWHRLKFGEDPLFVLLSAEVCNTLEEFFESSIPQFLRGEKVESQKTHLGFYQGVSLIRCAQIVEEMECPPILLVYSWKALLH